MTSNDAILTKPAENDGEEEILITRMCGFCQVSIPEKYLGDHQAVSCEKSPSAKMYRDGMLPADPSAADLSGGMANSVTGEAIDWNNAPPGTVARPAIGGVAVKKRWTKRDIDERYPKVTVVPPHDFTGNRAITVHRITFELPANVPIEVPSIVADIMQRSLTEAESRWVPNSDGRTPGQQHLDVPGLHRFNTTGPVRD